MMPQVVLLACAAVETGLKQLQTQAIDAYTSVSYMAKSFAFNYPTQLAIYGLRQRNPSTESL